MDARYAERDAGIVGGVARREIVGPVEHDLLPLEQRTRIRCVEPRLDPARLDAGVERRERRDAGTRLQFADRGIPVQHLSLQVAEFDAVVVEQCQVPHARRREIKRRR